MQKEKKDLKICDYDKANQDQNQELALFYNNAERIRSFYSQLIEITLNLYKPDNTSGLFLVYGKSNEIFAKLLHKEAKSPEGYEFSVMVHTKLLANLENILNVIKKCGGKVLSINKNNKNSYKALIQDSEENRIALLQQNCPSNYKSLS